MFLINVISHRSPSFLSGCNLSYYKIFSRAGNFALRGCFAASVCVVFCQIKKFLEIYYFYIIVKMSLQPDEMTSRVGFGPEAVVWKLLL